jgi:hypothetical protein
MKLTIIALLAGLTVLAGCSRNEIEIQNITRTTVYFQFRGDSYPVEAGGTRSIVDMPNGAYAYTSTVEVYPPAAATSLGQGLSGNLNFMHNQTLISFLYSSNETGSGSALTYTVSANYSSSDPISSSTSVTSP